MFLQFVKDENVGSGKKFEILNETARNVKTKIDIYYDPIEK